MKTQLEKVLMQNSIEVQKRLSSFVPKFKIGQMAKVLKNPSDRDFEDFYKYFGKTGKVLDYKVLTGVFSSRIEVDYFIDFGVLGCVYVREYNLDLRFAKKQGLFYSYQLNDVCECGKPLILILVNEDEIIEFKTSTFIKKDTLVKCFNCHNSLWTSGDTDLLPKETKQKRRVSLCET